MITLTRLDDRPVVVNAERILTIEAAPDTILTLTSGDKLTVREPVEEVVARVVEYRRRVTPTVRLRTIRGGTEPAAATQGGPVGLCPTGGRRELGAAPLDVGPVGPGPTGGPTEGRRDLEAAPLDDEEAG